MRDACKYYDGTCIHDIAKSICILAEKTIENSTVKMRRFEKHASSPPSPSQPLQHFSCHGNQCKCTIIS